jgi:hypothetical protein
LPLVFAGVAALLGALHVTDPEAARQVIARDLGYKAAQAAMFTSIISFGAAWIGDFPRLWSRSALALAISVASHFAVLHVI